MQYFDDVPRLPILCNRPLKAHAPRKTFVMALNFLTRNNATVEVLVRKAPPRKHASLKHFQQHVLNHVKFWTHDPESDPVVDRIRIQFTIDAEGGSAGLIKVAPLCAVEFDPRTAVQDVKNIRQRAEQCTLCGRNGRRIGLVQLMSQPPADRFGIRSFAMPFRKDVRRGGANRSRLEGMLRVFNVVTATLFSESAERNCEATLQAGQPIAIEVTEKTTGT